MYKVNVNRYGTTVFNLESDSRIEITSLLILFLSNRGDIENEQEEHDFAEDCFDALANSWFFRFAGFLFTFTNEV